MFYERGDYYSAAQYYAKFLTSKNAKTALGNYQPYMVKIAAKGMKKEANTYENVVYRLAESYRMYFDYSNAEKWYGVSTQFDSASFPLAHYWYGVSLRANTKYSEAQGEFKHFLQGRTLEDEYTNSAKKELANCKFIQEQLSFEKFNVQVDKMNSFINQGGATYAPVWMDNKTFVFTSSRGDSAAIAWSKGTNPYFNNLYQSSITDSGYSLPVKVKVDVNKSLQQGAAVFTADGRRMFLTRWVQVEGKNKGAIYMSEKSGPTWSDPVKLNISVNVEGYSSIQPFVTIDGKHLVFASDRPGGVGKYDLWYSVLDANGIPGPASNMGTSINTVDDEEAPFYHAATNTLVFASNGRVGMGGFDLYSSKGDFAGWAEVKNLGYPINSTKDDIYFSSRGRKYLFTDANFSSDRSSVCCLELFELKRKSLYVTGKLVDCGTNEPMVGARVNVVDTITNKIVYTQDIDATGTYGFEIEEFMPLKVVGEKKYYLPKSLHFYKPGESGADTLMNPDLCLKHEDTAKPYPVGQPVVMKDIYYDFDKATLRPESFPILDTLAKVMRMYPDMVVEMSAHTDSKGTEKYNLKLSDARARSCVEYLIKVGIETMRLQSKGYGKCCPIAPNTTPSGKDNPDGRALNRRTELKVIHY
ncbi:outer membrane lipoprotein omp16 precursor [Filimonas lacunae]|nr:outer membrane lipoprotein omp16 precursor [Filimonas lacunae]